MNTKRFTSALVALAMACCTLVSIAFADEVSLAHMTDDEVVALLSQVQQEIADRHIEKSAKVPAGSYLVGEDVPAGTYTVYCKYDGDWWADIYVIADAGNGDTLVDYTVFAANADYASFKGEGTWTISLNDGELFKCTSEVTLTISAGLKFN